MRHLRRSGAATAAFAALTLLMAGTALAGNFAEVTITSDADDPPAAGEEREIRFSMLQHGITPISDGRVELTATLPGSGDRLSVPATSLGGGEWAAIVTFPAGGDWQLHVTHDVFETSAPTSLAVAPVAAGPMGAALAVGMLGAAAAAVLAGMLLIRRARGSGPRRAAATAVRPG